MDYEESADKFTEQLYGSEQLDKGWYQGLKEQLKTKVWDKFSERYVKWNLLITALDVGTTYLGLKYLNAREANPISNSLIGSYGLEKYLLANIAFAIPLTYAASLGVEAITDYLAESNPETGSGMELLAKKLKAKSVADLSLAFISTPRSLIGICNLGEMTANLLPRPYGELAGAGVKVLGCGLLALAAYRIEEK